eukprot:18949_1
MIVESYMDFDCSLMHISCVKHWKNLLFFCIGLAMNYIIYLLTDKNRSITTHIQYQLIDYHQKIQNEFLSDIDYTQSNCLNDRFLLFPMEFGDGFANIHHYIGEALLVSISTNRTLYLYGNFKYYGQCKNYSLSNNWYCIYDSFTNCRMPQHIKHIITEKLSNKQRRLTTNDGTLKASFQNYLYRIYFGDEKIIEYSIKQFGWKDGIFNQKWFNKFDNVFIRSHIQYYIWMKMNKNTKNILNSNPLIKQIKELHNTNEKYIAFHFRKTDNIMDVYHGFGIIADDIFSMEYYMNIVRDNIDMNDNLNTIFVCTDSIEIIEDIQNNYEKNNNNKWHFVYNVESKRVSTSERVWFLNDINDNE